jgi:hypothetical protein
MATATRAREVVGRSGVSADLLAMFGELRSRVNVPPLVGRAGAGSDGLVTDLQFKLGVAGDAIGEAEAKLRRAASARLLRMEIEGILTVVEEEVSRFVCGRKSVLRKLNLRWRYTIDRGE